MARVDAIFSLVRRRCDLDCVSNGMSQTAPMV